MRTIWYLFSRLSKGFLNSYSFLACLFLFLSILSNFLAKFPLRRNHRALSRWCGGEGDLDSVRIVPSKHWKKYWKEITLWIWHWTKSTGTEWGTEEARSGESYCHSAASRATSDWSDTWRNSRHLEREKIGRRPAYSFWMPRALYPRTGQKEEYIYYLSVFKN